MNAEQMYDFLMEYEICSEDFLRGAIAVGGFNEETMEVALFYHTGYRSFEAFIEDEIGEDE